MTRSPSVALMPYPSPRPCAEPAGAPRALRMFGRTIQGRAGRAHSLGRQLHGLEDLEVPRAPTEVPHQPLGDLTARGRGVALEQCLRGHQYAGCAVPALRRSKLREGLLQRMKASAACQPFDRSDLSTLQFYWEGQAAQNGCSIDQHRAGAALPQLATVLGARQPDVLAQDLQQGLMHGDDDIP